MYLVGSTIVPEGSTLDTITTTEMHADKMAVSGGKHNGDVQKGTKARGRLQNE